MLPADLTQLGLHARQLSSAGTIQATSGPEWCKSVAPPGTASAVCAEAGRAEARCSMVPKAVCRLQDVHQAAVEGCCRPCCRHPSAWVLNTVWLCVCSYLATPKSSSAWPTAFGSCTCTSCWDDGSTPTRQRLLDRLLTAEWLRQAQLRQPADHCWCCSLTGVRLDGELMPADDDGDLVSGR